MLGSNIKEDENLILLLAAIIGLFWGAFVDLQWTEIVEFGLVHSGWKGTSKSIVSSAISIFFDYGSSKDDIKIYLGPSIKSCCYEIKDDVAKYFDQKFIIKNNQKLFLDLESKINDFVIEILDYPYYHLNLNIFFVQN